MFSHQSWQVCLPEILGGRGDLNSAPEPQGEPTASLPLCPAHLLLPGPAPCRQRSLQAGALSTSPRQVPSPGPALRWRAGMGWGDNPPPEMIQEIGSRRAWTQADTHWAGVSAPGYPEHGAPVVGVISVLPAARPPARGTFRGEAEQSPPEHRVSGWTERPVLRGRPHGGC